MARTDCATLYIDITYWDDNGEPSEWPGSFPCDIEFPNPEEAEIFADVLSELASAAGNYQSLVAIRDELRRKI